MRRKPALRVKVYPVLLAAVEHGIASGWRRAHKHQDQPTPDQVQDTLVDAVMAALCEALVIPEDEDV